MAKAAAMLLPRRWLKWSPSEVPQSDHLGVDVVATQESRTPYRLSRDLRTLLRRDR